MNHDALRRCRSLLFLPASNPRAIEKARGVPADLIILDLEDAVKAEDKAAARAAAIQALGVGFGGRPAAVRINGHSTPWYGDDVVALRHSGASYVVVPKVHDPTEVRDAGGLAEKPVLAMIETALGVLKAAAIAPMTAGLIAGTNDLAADLGIPADSGRAGLAHSLQAIILAARAAAVPAFDGVHNMLDDAEGLVAQCEEGRAYGFDGKSLIHPAQIDICNRLFGPSEKEIEAARRLIAAATGGAERHEGRMIEALHVEQARAVLAKGRL